MVELRQSVTHTASCFGRGALVGRATSFAKNKGNLLVSFFSRFRICIEDVGRHESRTHGVTWDYKLQAFCRTSGLA